MKRMLAAAACLLAVLIAVYAAGHTALRRAIREPWPLELGAVETLPMRFPRQEANAAAQQLMVLARPLGIDFRRHAGKDAMSVPTSIATYVTSNITRGEVEITAPPADLVAYLGEHSKELDAVRDLLLRERIAWPIDLSKRMEAPLPNLLADIHLARVFTARALVRSREGDPSAWHDLHAAWRISADLQARPEAFSQLIALSVTRTVNATAWKLPLPAPAWLAEMQPVRPERLILRGLQHEAWSIAEYGKPFLDVMIAGLVNHERRTAEKIARVTACGFDGEAFGERELRSIPRWNVFARIVYPDYGDSFRRAFRFRAEREATVNALRIRAGEAPVRESQCTDGQWLIRGRLLAFSRELPRGRHPEMPLTLTLPETVANHDP